MSHSAILLNVDHNTLLDRLPYANGAAFDSHAEEHNPTCLPGTRTDVLERVYEWAGDPAGEPIFWLDGMAGTGKSTISRTVSRVFAGTGNLGASFFFKRVESERSQFTKFFSTLARQLILREPLTAPYIMQNLEEDATLVHKSMREQFEKLILNPLSKAWDGLATYKYCVIVVDALDECESEQDVKLMIRLLSLARPQKSPMKLFVTSRPEHPIRLEFSRLDGGYRKMILHELPRLVIEKDIHTYLSHELARIRVDFDKMQPASLQLGETWPEKSDVESLANMASPLFIVAATACRFIGERRSGRPDRQMAKLLEYQTTSHNSQLYSTYQPVLDQQIVGLSSADRKCVVEEFQYIVGTIINLIDPLSKTNLSNLLGVPPDVIDTRLDMLHSVLSVPMKDTSPVRLLHLSFREYLLDPEIQEQSVFGVDQETANANIASKCFAVMMQELKEDICNMKAPGTDRNYVSEEKLNFCLPDHLRYACLYWTSHVQKANVPLLDDGQCWRFLEKHFLHWLEAMVYLRKVEGVIPMLRTLKSVQVSEQDHDNASSLPLTDSLVSINFFALRIPFRCRAVRTI